MKPQFHSDRRSLRASLPWRPPRRDFLGDFATGLGGVALAALLGRDGLLHAAAPGPPDAEGNGRTPPHHPPRARRIVQIFLVGGLSHMDSFDYKPALEKYHGTRVPESLGLKPFAHEQGLLQQSHFPFRRYGECAKWASDLFPEINGIVDDLTFIHSMVSSTAAHAPAVYEANCGFREAGYPAVGSWLSYGLGSASDDLPAFVSVPERGNDPTGSGTNWSNGFLPARHQAVVFRSQGEAVRDLRSFEPLEDETRRARYELLNEMNRRHLEEQGPHDELAARIRSYELAGRMQSSVPEVANFAEETKPIQDLYGIDRPECGDFARSCLLARRLLERGVQFVQLWSGGRLAHWDAHEHLHSNHASRAQAIDRPVAGLVRDLKQRGLLDDTLVIFNTEFGRTCATETKIEGRLGLGRDHNPRGFTIWLAGGGTKPGLSYGATDEFGVAAVENPMNTPDFHATLLHLLGLDHERLTFESGGRNFRLTNVSGKAHHGILA